MKRILVIIFFLFLISILVSCSQSETDFEKVIYDLKYNPVDQKYGEMFLNEDNEVCTFFIKDISGLEIFNIDQNKSQKFDIPDNSYTEYVSLQKQKGFAGDNELKMLVYFFEDVERKTIGFLGIKKEKVVFYFDLFDFVEIKDDYDILDFEKIDPFILENGNILIAYSVTQDGKNDYTRLIQVNPFSIEIVSDCSIHKANLLTKDVYNNMIFLFDPYNRALTAFDIYNGEKLYELNSEIVEGFTFSGPGYIYDDYYYTVNRKGLFKTKLDDGTTVEVIKSDECKYINGNGTDFRDIIVLSENVLYISVANNIGTNFEGDSTEDLSFIKYDLRLLQK